MEEILLPEAIQRLVDSAVNAVETRLANVFEQVERFQGAIRPEYLSIAQAADYTGLSAKHIRRAIRRGDLLCANTGTGKRPKYSIARTHIADWMEANRLKQGPSKASRQALVEELFPKRQRGKQTPQKAKPRCEAGQVGDDVFNPPTPLPRPSVTSASSGLPSLPA